MAAGTIKQGYIENRFEERMMERLGRIRRRDMKNSTLYGAGYKKVYICSPYAGDVAANEQWAMRFCRYAIGKKCQPLASHLLYPRFLDDMNEREREMGISFGIAIMKECEEVWVFREYKGISPGMAMEIEEAKRVGIPVVFINDPKAYDEEPWDIISEHLGKHGKEMKHDSEKI